MNLGNESAEEQLAESGDDSSDNSEDEGGTVIDARHPLQDPTTPFPYQPLFRYFPGGAAHKVTARKHAYWRNPANPSAYPYPPRRPRLPSQWGAQVRTWGIEEGLPSTFEVGESSQAPAPPQPETPAEAAMPALVARLARHERQLNTMSDEISTQEIDNEHRSHQIRLLEEDRNLDEEAINLIQDIQARHTTQIAEMAQQIANAEARATEAERTAEEIRRHLDEWTRRQGGN